MTTTLRPGSPREVGMLPARLEYARDLCARWVKEGHTRILSPASVAAMTRDQIPGLGARVLLKVVDRASWGYGWQIVSPTKWKYFDGSLQPLGTFGHPGAGGANYWIDREHELIGAYFEVTTRVSRDLNLLWNFDLFQNAITAAVED